MSKFHLYGVKIALDPDTDPSADIRALWDEVCHGHFQMTTLNDFSRIYGMMEYDQNQKPAFYTVTWLEDDDIERLNGDGYAKFVATSTVSAEDANDTVWAKANTVDRDFYGDLEHFIDNPDRTFTCELYVSIMGEV